MPPGPYGRSPPACVINAKALSIMRYQDDIYTEHNMKTVCRAAVAQWTMRLTRNEKREFKSRKAHIFNITLVLYLRSILYYQIPYLYGLHFLEARLNHASVKPRNNKSQN